MADQDVRVIIIGDSRSVERAFGRSSKAAKEFDSTLTRSASRVDNAFTKLDRVRTGAFLGGAAATAAIVGIKRVTDAASDLAEQISKNRQVFGQSATAIEAWSRTTSRSIGISQTAALTAVGTFGNLFDAIGIAGPQAAATSRQLVKLAADLASFNNADPSDVLDAIRSGLIGEAEPLRRFGVLLSETRVQQIALAQTGKTSVKALTDQEKALARVAIILKDTANAQGDFERTSESLANQQRILAARTADLEANLGRLLLPAVTKITEALVEATDAALLLTDALSKIGDIEIPAIEIPIIGKEIPGTGSTIGDTVAGIVKDALDPRKIAARALPGGQLALTLEKLGIVDIFDTDKMKGEVDAAAQAAIDEVFAGFKLPEPKLRPAAEFGNLPGVDFGFADSITGAVDDVLAGSRKAIAAATRNVEKGLNVEKAEKAFEKQRDRFSAFIDSLELKVDRAGLTSQLSDDVAALQTLKAGLEKQIRSGVDVSTAQSRLVGVVGDIADKQRQIAAKAQEVAQARQFKALGLTGAGEEIIPTIENLKKQLASLSERLIDSDVTSKLTSRLAGVRKILSGQFGKATEETRAAIRDLFETIRGEFDKGTKGPLTKTTQANISALTKGLTLPFEDLKTLQSRLSSLNTAGMQLAAPRGTVGAFGVPVSGTLPPVHVHVELDRQEVGSVLITDLQKKSRRSTATTRGPFAGRRSGV